MSLFKKKTKAPEHSRIIGIYTAQTKTVSVMDSPDTETKSPNVLDILSYHQSVYIIDDFNQEYYSNLFQLDLAYGFHKIVLENQNFSILESHVLFSTSNT